MAVPVLEKARRIVGPERAKVGEWAKAQYVGGASVRAIAEDLQRSYGFVHRLLEEQGVTMRHRGGATR